MARRATRVCLITKQLKSISTAVKFASRIVNFGLFSNFANPSVDAGIRGQSLPRIGKPTIKPSRSRCQLQQWTIGSGKNRLAAATRFRPPGICWLSLCRRFAWKSRPLPDKNRKYSLIYWSGEKGWNFEASQRQRRSCSSLQLCLPALPKPNSTSFRRGERPTRSGEVLSRAVKRRSGSRPSQSQIVRPHLSQFTGSETTPVHGDRVFGVDDVINEIETGA